MKNKTINMKSPNVSREIDKAIQETMNEADWIMGRSDGYYDAKYRPEQCKAILKNKNLSVFYNMGYLLGTNDFKRTKSKLLRVDKERWQAVRDESRTKRKARKLEELNRAQAKGIKKDHERDR